MTLRLLRTAVIAGAVLAAMLAGGSQRAQNADAGLVTVYGAGSTWDQIATNQWEADVHTLYGLTIDYSGVGSSSGREFYIENQVDFADSDIPFQEIPGDDEVSQIQSEHKTYQYLPTVAGATGIMYNLRTPSGTQITNLRLNSAALVGIFTGTITSWTNPIITNQNPQLRGQIPNTRIIPVVRSDGSGTSAMFSSYLAQLQPGAWHQFCVTYQIDPCGQTSYWPLGIPGSIAQKGSDGVANYVQQQFNTITYVETGYALERNFPVALVENASGHYVYPSAKNDAIALTYAHILPDLISDLTDVHTAPNPDAYPIAGYSYLITPTQVGFGFTDEKGYVLSRFILYMACAGQQKAAALGYAPLTPVLVRGVFARVEHIPGHAPVPPLNAKTCPNPTITGAPIKSPTGNTGGTGASNPGGGSSTRNQTGAGHQGKKHKSGSGKKVGTSHPTSGGTKPTGGNQLSAAAMAARRDAVSKAVDQIHPASSKPLAFAAVDAVVVAMVPWLLLRWRRRQDADDGGGPIDGDEKGTVTGA